MISGPEFRLKRAAEGFSGREVARCSGINHSHENLWERGRLILRDDQIERLTRCLRILTERKARRAARPPAPPQPIPIEEVS